MLHQCASIANAGGPHSRLRRRFGSGGIQSWFFTGTGMSTFPWFIQEQENGLGNNGESDDSETVRHLSDGLIDSSGIRLDGVNISSGAHGRHLAWDVTDSCTVTPPDLKHSSGIYGWVTEHADQKIPCLTLPPPLLSLLHRRSIVVNTSMIISRRSRNEWKWSQATDVRDSFFLR